MLAKTPFDEAWNLFDLAKAAEIEANLIQERASPCDAEVVPGAAADWFLVQTYPGDDVRAMRWLARRRFGVFRPMQQRSERKSGRKLQGWEPAFPGWLFVFCWDIENMHRRILNCPGVLGILADPVTGRPAPIDQPEMTLNGRACMWPRVGFVDKIRALSWIYDEAAPAAGALRTHVGVKANRQIKRSIRKLGPKERRELRRLSVEIKRCHLFDEQEWKDANRLDPGRRIALLKRTLMSASDAGGRASHAMA